MDQKFILNGEKVQLVPFEIKSGSEHFVNWRRNSEYLRLMDGSHAVQFSKDKIKSWLEEDALLTQFVFFMIKTTTEERIIGEIGLSGFDGKYVNAFVGISIGDPADWGQGYGSEAMRLILNYGFYVMNLHHISLTVFEYNPRAIRSYEKVGFKHEGIQRQFLNRDGRRWDMIRMGILKSEWEQITIKED